LRSEFFAALAADPWDRSNAEEALAALQAAEGAQHAALGRLLIDAFEGLSPEDRKALAEANRKRFGKLRMLRHGRGSPVGEEAPNAD
jgi:uncharacterized membrane protein